MKGQSRRATTTHRVATHTLRQKAVTMRVRWRTKTWGRNCRNYEKSKAGHFYIVTYCRLYKICNSTLFLCTAPASCIFQTKLELKPLIQKITKIENNLLLLFEVSISIIFLNYSFYLIVPGFVYTFYLAITLSDCVIAVFNVSYFFWPYSIFSIINCFFFPPLSFLSSRLTHSYTGTLRRWCHYRHSRSRNYRSSTGNCAIWKITVSRPRRLQHCWQVPPADPAPPSLNSALVLILTLTTTESHTKVYKYMSYLSFFRFVKKVYLRCLPW